MLQDFKTTFFLYDEEEDRYVTEGLKRLWHKTHPIKKIKKCVTYKKKPSKSKRRF